MSYIVNDSSLKRVANSIRNKTGDSAPLKFPDGFINAISSIDGSGSGGGGSVSEEIVEKDVNFYDYDGALIASYTEAEAKALTELPTPPEHDGLVFQGWNYTLEEVVKYAKAADVGALYVTDDGKTRILIDAYMQKISLYFTQTKSSGILVDWGDGKTTRSDDNPAPVIMHAYEATGNYTITILPDDDCEITLGSGTGSYLGLCDGGIKILEVNIGKNVVSLETKSFCESKYLKKISICEGVRIQANVFLECYDLEYITMPRKSTAIYIGVLQDCYSLKHISIAPVVSVVRRAFLNCISLERIVVNGNYEFFTDDGPFLCECYALKNMHLSTNTKVVLNGNVLSDCTQLLTVIVDANVSTIEIGFLSNSPKFETLDLSKSENVVTLNSAKVFTECDTKLLKILVPAALADEWKKATNWTAYADNIIGV